VTMNGGRTAYHRAPGLLEKAAHAILNNFIVEAALVSAISALYVCARAADHILGTRLRRAFLDGMQAVSRDRLNFLMKDQDQAGRRLLLALHPVHHKGRL
jgi:hypothetical protein